MLQRRETQYKREGIENGNGSKLPQREYENMLPYDRQIQ